MVPCGTCRNPVDPLRAERVAMYGDTLYYFCSAECRAFFQVEPRVSERRTPLPPALPLVVPDSPSTSSVRGTTGAPVPTPTTSRALLELGGGPFEALDEPTELPSDYLSSVADPALELPQPSPLTSYSRSTAGPTELFSLLVTLAALGGVLGVALVLAGESGAVLVARWLVVLVAGVSLSTALAMVPRDPASLSPVLALAAPLSGVVLAGVGILSVPGHSSNLVTLASVIVTQSALSAWFTARARSVVETERAQLQAALDPVAKRLVGNELTSVSVGDLHPGEEVVVGEEEIVPADGIVVAGSAEVCPWFGSSNVTRRSEGEAVVAGSRVRSGQVRIVVTWTGFDRTWARLALDPRQRADVFGQLARAGRQIAERGAPLAAAIAALAAFAANLSWLEVLAYAVATQATLAHAGQAEVAALHVARSIAVSLRRGIAFRNAESLDRAGRVSTAVFCARGTLLLGEPEVASIDTFAQNEPSRVLELAAGAEASALHPAAAAVHRAARSRNIRPDAVRSPLFQPGLGVTAIASNGQPLVVGSRALMLREYISVAIAEAKITDLEALGRSVLLVALGGRLVGVIGLQDGLRPGARAAVQHLLDVGVEPVLISGDTRETCEALGRALDIDHVRPEIMPSERGEEVRRLVEGGATVAVIGRSPADDIALSAAEVSVALSTAGSGAAEWNVQLASDDTRDAAFAVRLAHRCRTEALLGLALTLGSATVGILLTTLALVPTPVAPILGLLGTVAAILRWQSATD